MAGTMEGLGVPLFGGYTSFQSDGTTAYLTVNADGTQDYSWTDESTDNYIDVTLVETAANTSGYFQAFHADITHTGGVSGGQINAFAVDLTLGGTITSEISGMYVYIDEDGTTAADFGEGSILAGYTAYLAAFGDAQNYRAGFHAYSAEVDATVATLDAALLVESVGTSGTWGAVLGVMGSTPPKYFMDCNNAPGEARMFSTGVVANIAATGLWMRVLIQDTTYWIALHASCTS